MQRRRVVVRSSDSSHDPHDTGDKLTADRIRAWSRRWGGKQSVMLADFALRRHGGAHGTTRGAESTRSCCRRDDAGEDVGRGRGQHSPFTEAVLQVSRTKKWEGSVIELYLLVKQISDRVKIGRLPGDEEETSFFRLQTLALSSPGFAVAAAAASRGRLRVDPLFVHLFLFNAGF